MYVASAPTNDMLRLYSAPDLRGPWTEHPKSPVVRHDPARARPAGRVLITEGRIVRFAQDCLGGYGLRGRAFEVSKLSSTEYTEKELDWSGLTASGVGWNAEGMHHVDLHQRDDGSWLACVDGWRTAYRFDLSR